MVQIVLKPGVVRSKNDGQLHYINAHQLIKLYKIPKTVKPTVFIPRQAYPEGTIFLTPLYEGNYQEVAEKHNFWRNL